MEEKSFDIDVQYRMKISFTDTVVTFKVEERKPITSFYYNLSYHRTIFCEENQLDNNTLENSLYSMVKEKQIQYSIDGNNMKIQLNSITLILTAEYYEQKELISKLIYTVNSLYIENEKKALQIDKLTKEIAELQTKASNTTDSENKIEQSLSTTSNIITSKHALKDKKKHKNKDNRINIIYNQIPKFSIETSTLFNSKLVIELLTKVFKKPFKAYLKYKATQDGEKAYNFHRHCVGMSPTLTVIKTTNKQIIGGYTEAQWINTLNYVEDEKAFLFKLTSNGYKIYEVNESVYALNCRKNLGPSFGKSDLIINEEFLSKEGQGSTRRDSYSIEEGDSLLDNDNIEIFSIKDIEVYYIEKE